MLTMGFFSFQGARLVDDSMDEDELRTLQRALDLSYGDSKGEGAGEGGSSNSGTSSMTQLVGSGAHGAAKTGAELGLTQSPQVKIARKNADQKFCISCGTSIVLRAKFCHECGDRQD
jgi:membrane protease subunit (stomatin/prohibitin family)